MAAPPAVPAAAPLAAPDQARIEAALRDAHSANTRRQYRSAWCSAHGHAVMPAALAAVAAYLAHRTAHGAAAATVRTIRAATHRDRGAPDPTAHDGVRRVLQGLARQAAGRGRGQAQPFTADGVSAILATAGIPRRTGRGTESATAAAERAAVDKAIVGLLFQGGLRRSEAAALTWADVQDATDSGGVLVRVRRSKTDQEATAAAGRYLKSGCAAALRALRLRRQPQPADLVLGGLNGRPRRRHRGPHHRPLRARRACFRVDRARSFHH